MGTRGTYRTIHCSLPDDPEFQRVSAAAQHVFYTLRISKEHGASGIFRYYPSLIATRCHRTLKQVLDALRELAAPKRGREYGWIVYDDAICWVVNGLRHDPHVSLANGNHKKTILREISELPTRQIVLKYCDYYKLDYPFGTHLHQDKEEEKEKESKEKEKEPTPSPRGIPSEAVPWGSKFCLIQKYNRETPANVPTVESPSPSRLKREATYLRLYPEEAWWTETFLQYHRSRFLSGRVTPAPGHEAFRPDFDWLVSKGKDGVENCVKVHDGRYRDG